MAYVDDTVKELAPRVVALEIDHEVEDMAIVKAQITPAAPERVIYFRDLNSWDIPQMRALHEEWFPIRYNQAFYDGAAQGMWMETGGPLFARLAVEMRSSPDLQNPVQPNPEDRRDENILGAVTASTLPLSKVDDPDLISPDDWEHTHIMYILTLGTRSSVRRMGIASELLQECIAQACRQPQCGAVYLHVKADNVSARHFYEKNGFQNLRYLQDYYMIDGVRHDAFLYIRYVNGAAPQSGWFDLITRPLFALLSIASFGWKKLIEGFNVEEFKDSNTDKLTLSTASAPIESASIVLVSGGPMNFQDLLNEVEDAMKSPRSGGGGTGGHTVGVKYANDEESFPIIALPSSKGRGKNDLDDLLDMLGDEDSKPTAVHPRPKSSSRAGAYNSPDSKISRTEFQAGGNKKCPQVLLDGGHASRGLSTAFSSRACSNLRCNECDFTVVQFPGKKWDASVDYMFFRENVPSEAKLRVKMEIAPDFTAYACQCKWLSICSQTRMDNCQVKWSCAGH
ncbi:Retinal Maintenance domain-containing protein [Phytophthora infestans]|uniref:Cilia- and flagella-associated protein 418 n=1 Tax=Phytophthora infestans TaxID=4787 RepID=A0A8S9TQ09_PHYIN|nr:Retinal Maintenance domain-containing protein [Phytophthora infestans]